MIRKGRGAEKLKSMSEGALSLVGEVQLQCGKTLVA